MKNISNEAEKDLNNLICSFQNDEKVLYKSSINGKISLENGKIYMLILSIIVLVMFFLSLYKSKDANNRLNKGRGFPDPIGYDPISHERLYAKSDFDKRDKLAGSKANYFFLFLITLLAGGFGILYIYKESYGYRRVNYVVLTNKNIYKQTITPLYLLNNPSIKIKKIKNSDIENINIENSILKINTLKGASIELNIDNPEFFNTKFKEI
jgi:hypothetical protein